MSCFLDLAEGIEALGFDGVLYSFFPRPMYMNEKVQPHIDASDEFKPFVAHYLAQGYIHRDFVLRMAMSGRVEPIDWWQEINEGNVTAEEIEVTLDAKTNFGIQNGLSVAVLDGSYAVAGISVISKRLNDSEFKELKLSSLEKLKQLAIEYHGSVAFGEHGLSFYVKPFIESLSQTKRNVIRHLLTGKPMKSIDSDLKLSEGYAKNVLAEIKKEFGNFSTVRLAYYLGQLDIERYLN